MVAYQFFSRCVAGVAYVQIPRVVAVAEYFAEGEGGGPIYFTCRLVYYFADSFYFILVIIHFDDENFGLCWYFFVRYFSRRAIYTFQRALADLFVGLLVCGHPLLIFLPCLIIETRAGEYWGWEGSAGGSAPPRRELRFIGDVKWLRCHYC